MSETSAAVIVSMLCEPILSPQASFKSVQANRANWVGLINTDLLAS